MSSRTKKVAVIGAGISGLTVRCLLRHAGAIVDTFDKGGGPGGRTSRRRFGEYHFDHGAQYFTATGADFRAQVQRWIDGGVVAPWQARIGVLQDGVWSENSDGPLRYVGVPGMNQPARALSAEVDGEIRYRCPIRSVSRRQDDSWSLIDDSGNSYEGYDALVVTIPPMQALEILETTTPARAILGGAVVDPCWAVMAVFEPALEIEWDAAFVQKEPLSWAARNNSKPGRPPHDAWVLHATAGWSRQFVENDAQWVARQLVETFCDALGRQPRLPLWSAAHRWRYARPRTQVPDGFWWDGTAGLGFCGDWCIGGRVEGAYSSARLLCERVVNDAVSPDPAS